MNRITICKLPKVFNFERLKSKWDKQRIRNQMLWDYADEIAQEETQVFAKAS